MYALIGTVGFSLVFLIAAMYYRGEMLEREASLIGLQHENNTLIAATETIKETNRRINKTLDFTLSLHRDQIGKADEYQNKLTASENKTRQALSEIDELRRTEHKKALEKPFERGNSARNRIISIVCRAWGQNDNPQCSGERSNGNARTNPRDEDKSRDNADNSTNVGDHTGRSEVLP